MTDAASWPAELQGSIDRWLQAEPEQQAALTFVDKQRYPGHYALAALQQELLDAAYGFRDVQIVANKLQWWVSELTEAPDSGGQHPLTRVLFAQSQARAIPVAIWTAPALAAMARLEQGTAPDFQAQLAAAEPLHGALARLETSWWYGLAASAEHAARVATLSHLVHALRRLPQGIDRDRLPLPMVLLAKHGLSRELLRQPGAGRTEAVKAQLRDLLGQWRDADDLPGPLGVFRAVEARCARHLAGQALAAPDSLGVLAAPSARPGVLDTVQAWRMALAWQRAHSRMPGGSRAHARAPE